MARRPRKWLRRLAYVAVPVGVLAVTALALVGTGPGRGLIARAIEAAVSTPDMTVDIGTLDLPSLGRPRIDRLVATDADGAWFEATGVEIDWQPLALMSGRVAIDRLAAATVAMVRIPNPSADTAEDDGTTLAPIAIGQIALPNVALGQAVLGTTAEVRVTGNLHLVDPAEGLSGALDIERIDGVPGTIASRFAYRPQDEHLTLHLDAREPAGGLIVRSLDLPGLPDFAAVVDGEGPLDDWQASVSASAGGRPVLSGTARLARIDGGRLLTVAANGDLQSVIPGEAAMLFEGRSRLDLQAHIADDRRVILRSGELAAANLQATATGTVTPAGAVESGTMSLTLARPDGRLALGSGGPSVVSAHVEATLQPDATVDFRATVEGLQSPEIEIATVAISGAGRIVGPLTGMPKEITGVAVEGTLDGIAMADPQAAALLGRTLAFSGTGSVRGAAITIAESTVRAESGRAGFTGTINGDRVDGRYTLSASDLSHLSAVAGRDLAGALDLAGTLRTADGGQEIAVTVDGETRELRTGSDAADRLLGGRATVKGGFSRSADGAFRFDDLAIAAQHLAATIDGEASAQSARIVARGKVSDLGQVSTSLGGSVDFTADVSGTLDDAVITAAITGERMVIEDYALDQPKITFNGTGPLAAPRGELAVTGQFDGRPIKGSGTLSITRGAAVDNLALAIGRSRATGRLSFDPDSGIAGAVSVAISDLAEWQDLAGVGLGGTLHSDITLTTTDGVTDLAASGRGSDLKADTVTIGALSLDGTVKDLFGTAVADGRVEASPVRIGDFSLDGVDVTARADGGTTRGGVKARLGDSVAAISGALRVEDGRVTVDLADGGKIVVADGGATLTNAAVSVDSGRATVTGTAGERNDLTVRLDDLPARIVGAFVPDLDPQGTVSGTVTVKGTADKPSVTFDLDWQGAAVAQTRDAGLATFALSTSGNVEGGVATLKGEIVGQSAIRLTFSGTAPAGANRPIDLTLKGGVPLNLVNPALAERGGSMDGTLSLDLAVTGQADAPKLTGSLSTSGARLNDPTSGIALTDVSMRARLDGDVLTVERFQGKTTKDGTISASGTISLAPADGLPADLKITARKFYVNDNQLIEGTLDADLTVTGPLTGGALVGGKVAVSRLDITIPDALPASIERLDVEHRNASPKVLRQVATLEKKEADGPSLPVRLDLRIDSGNRIFVRGRGLDVILGGDVTVTGTLDDPIVVGAFIQRRGKLDILGRSLNFTRGRLDFAGSLDPTLDFAATTSSSSASITIHVTGRARDPQFRFDSSPELPQDEVVSRFIFDRPVSKLTPLQIAQLSTELARLGGLAGGPGLLADLQKSLGLDVLEFSGGATGSGVAAGKYVSEKVYLGVKQSADGTSRALIDLDLTKTIKTKGEFGSDGSSKIGIGVELDY